MTTSNQSRRHDAILFDKDGTLFHFAATWEAWARGFLLRTCGQDQDRAALLGAQIGFDLEQGRFARDSVAIAGTPDEIAAALEPHLPGLSGGEIVDLLNDEAAGAAQADVIPLGPFLDGLLQSGLRLGVATNDGEAPARAHLEAAGVTARFDFIAGFDSGHGAKPGPGQLLAFCRVTGTDPARAVMVGDSTHDLIAGRAAGMATVGVLTGMAGAEELTPLADVVLPDIGHLPDWLGL